MFTRLDTGHGKGITSAEIAMLATWGDLAVPFCGTYDEATAWTSEEHRLYRRWMCKRAQTKVVNSNGL